MWRNDGAEIRSFSFPSGKPRSYARSANLYYSPGVTYPERTTSDLSPRILPSGCIFSGTGQGMFCGSSEKNLGYIAGSYSRAFKLIVDAIFGSGDASSPSSMATHYRSAVLGKLPPPVWRRAEELKDISMRLVARARQLFEADESSRFFVVPALIGKSLNAQIDSAVVTVARNTRATLVDHALVEEAVFEELELTEQEQEMVRAIVGPHPCSYEEASTLDEHELAQLVQMNESALIEFAVSKCGARRQLTMKSYGANRRFELIAHALKADVKQIASFAEERLLRDSDIEHQTAANNLSWLVAFALGRWDIRYATGEREPPELPDPFDPLPACPPGMLRNADGLSAEPKDVPTDYPLRINWDGILVDDPGFNGGQSHRDDIVRRVREVFDLLWKDKAHRIEQEACQILGVKELRDYFRLSASFFQDHLKRYSKSRRKAPIYWPLSTASGSYTVWLYYHRLTDQTLYAAVNKYVEPKITEVEHAAVRIEKELETASGREAIQLRDRLSEARTFVSELQELRQELLRIAALPYKPDLNDGVIINAAPFHNLFRLRSWAKGTEAVWKKLEKGDYDWAHLAHTLWPDRVKESCRTDRSIAIAHGIEEFCEVAPPAAQGRGKKKGRKKREVER